MKPLTYVRKSLRQLAISVAPEFQPKTGNAVQVERKLSTSLRSSKLLSQELEVGELPIVPLTKDVKVHHISVLDVCYGLGLIPGVF